MTVVIALVFLFVPRNQRPGFHNGLAVGRPTASFLSEVKPFHSFALSVAETHRNYRPERARDAA